VTRVDHEAILRSRAPAQRSRGLIGWLSGEYETPAAPEPPGTLAPPAAEVRREMLRLELAALEAEAQARRALLVSELADAGLIEHAEPDEPEPQDAEPEPGESRESSEAAASSGSEAPADT